MLVASFGKSLIVAEALIGIWELGGRWVGAPYSSDFHKREKWMTPNLPKYFSRGIIENGGTGRLKANCWLFFFFILEEILSAITILRLLSGKKKTSQKLLELLLEQCQLLSSCILSLRGDMSSLGMDISLKTGKGREATSEALKFML